MGYDEVKGLRNSPGSKDFAAIMGEFAIRSRIVNLWQAQHLHSLPAEPVRTNEVRSFHLISLIPMHFNEAPDRRELPCIMLVLCKGGSG
jgi:hypothetical protein